MPAASSLFAPTGQHQVQLIVKRYQDGEMGRYLHSLQPGRDEVEVRGWLDTWKPREGAERPDEIVMVRAIARMMGVLTL